MVPFLYIVKEVLRISSRLIFVDIVFSSYIFRRIISIVKFNGTLVKRLTTSKDIILYPYGTLTFLIRLMKSLVLSTVYCDLLNGERNLQRCLAVLCVAVPIFEMIGRIGSFSKRLLSLVFKTFRG